jgi:transcriptional regulator with XRE-family HTH domain
VKPKELRAIRAAMGLTQEELADRLRVARNTVARMERAIQAITPSMALLITYVAREAGVDIRSSHQKRSRGKASDLGEAARKPANPVRSHGSRSRKDLLPK